MVMTHRALRVEVVGEVTSFRYPHFTQGYQPTYLMPPPSTIYGLICSALGRWLTDEERAVLCFAYIFKHSGKFVDYKEHLHFQDPIQPFPFDRELLFQPRLTLYLVGLPFLMEAFENPHYTVTLGRSQDLMTFQKRTWVTLEQVDHGYFEHTLLPLEAAPRLARNISVASMARYITPHRQPVWQSYTLLHDLAVWPPRSEMGVERWDEEDALYFEEDDSLLACWAEQGTALHPKLGLPRIMCLHSFEGA